VPAIRILARRVMAILLFEGSCVTWRLIRRRGLIWDRRWRRSWTPVSRVRERIGVGTEAGGAGIRRNAVETCGHLQHRAFDDRTHRELDRLERAFAGARVEEGLTQEVEHAGLDLMADDL